MSAVKSLVRAKDCHRMDTNRIAFEFQPRWREEIVCSCSLGAFILEMTMGVTTVYLPTAER